MPSAAEVRALTPELIVAGATLLVMVWTTFLPSHRRGLLRWVAAGALGAALGATLALGPGRPSLFGGMYGRDPLTTVFQVFALVAALLALALAAAYVERARLDSGEFYALLLAASLGAMVMAGSTDLIMVFLGLETLSLPLYVLAGFARTDLRSQEAGLKYFLLGAFSTVIFLYGIALIYGATGSTALGRLTAVTAPPLLLDAGLGLVLIGLAFKAALVPFHGWAPDVYEGAPLPVTAYMSVIAKVGAFAALLRVFPATPGTDGRWIGVLALLSVLTLALANLAALRQTNLKRLLAYSSISHAGFILIGVAAGTAQGARAAVFYLLVYALMTLGAFAVVLHVTRRGGEADQIADLTGLASRSPALAAAMTVFMVSLAGIPPTAGFIGKLYVFTAALDAGQPVLALVGVLASVVSAYFYLRVAYTMFTGEPRGEVALTGDRWLTAALLVTVAATLALGVFPAPLTAFVQQTTQALR